MARKTKRKAHRHAIHCAVIAAGLFAGHCLMVLGREEVLKLFEVGLAIAGVGLEMVS